MEKSEFYKNARDDLPGPLAGVRVVESDHHLGGPDGGMLTGRHGGYSDKGRAPGRGSHTPFTTNAAGQSLILAQRDRESQ